MATNLTPWMVCRCHCWSPNLFLASTHDYHTSVFDSAKQTMVVMRSVQQGSGCLIQRHQKLMISRAFTCLSNRNVRRRLIVA